MLDLKNFKTENQVSLNALLKTRKELSEKRKALIKEVQTYQHPFDRSYLENPEYIKKQNTLNSDLETITDISNCISLYSKYGNISQNDVVDDRDEIINILSYEKASKDSFDVSQHRLGFIIIGNRLHKTSLEKGFDEYETEKFFSIDKAISHKSVENRFHEISKAMYTESTHWSVLDFIKDGYRVVYGYINNDNQFFETGYISK